MFYPGVSIITLGVRDVAAARAFYERAGWRVSTAASSAECAFFQLNNIAIALYDQTAFDSEMGLAGDAPEHGRPRFALAQNHFGPESVEAAVRRMVGAGARVVKPGAATAWGGYTALVEAPDGHVWELAWNPGFPLNADGTVELPP